MKRSMITFVCLCWLSVALFAQQPFSTMCSDMRITTREMQYGYDRDWRETQYTTRALPSHTYPSAQAYKPVGTITVAAERPTYVPALSGDLNPFGANAPRKAPPTTGTGGGNPINPGIHAPVPLSDAMLFLVVLAVGYGLCRRFRRNEVGEMPCDAV